MSPVSPPFPVPVTKMEKVAHEACNKVFSGVTEYTHKNVEIWNQTIINGIITDLNEDVASSNPPYKLAVSATIIQQPINGAKRGMYASIGAFWNAETDGMWTYKYSPSDGALAMDVVIKIIWMAY